MGSTPERVAAGQPRRPDADRAAAAGVPAEGQAQVGRGAGRIDDPGVAQVADHDRLINALANAHRWQRILDGGDYATVAELAAAERMNSSYLSRVLRLTLLAPAIVDAMLDGRQPAGMTLARLLEPFPAVWERQRQALGLAQQIPCSPPVVR